MTPAPLQSLWDENEIVRWHRLYSLRSHLAGFAAREAALRVREGGLVAPLEMRFGAMLREAARGDFAAFLEADLAFHRCVAQLAGAAPLEDIWILLEGQFREFAAWSHRALFRDLHIIAEAHRAQYQTIAAGNPAAAEHAAHVDLDALWQMLTEQPAQAGDEADPVERVCGYVLLNLHRPLSLTGVAREVAHLSTSQLARLFRERRGESFSAYVQRLRLRRAETLLRETELAVADIAIRVGYSDSSRFIAHFHRHFGCTPNARRKLAGNA